MGALRYPSVKLTQQFKLIKEVQMICRLVQEHHRGILGEIPGEKYPLELTP